MNHRETGERRFALVTGASRGIGRVAAVRLARAGFDVAINYRTAREEAKAVVREVEALGARAVALQADVSIPSEATKLVERAECELGPLDVLINNAGVTRDRLLVQMSEEDWNLTWATDVSGPRSVARSAISYMARRKFGRVINVGSVVGSLGSAGQANYAAAKSALDGLTRRLAVETASHGITVNCVVPGYVLTDATAHLTKEQSAAWLNRIPMNRPGHAWEIVEIVVFLVSDAASYVTGQCIAVDGGLLAGCGGYIAP